MREIKFRGKRIDNGELVYGNLYYKDKTAFIIEDSTTEHGSGFSFTGGNELVVSESFEVDVKTVGQYTGLKDKNGKEIYEGDIVEREDWSGRKLKVIVEFGWWGEEIHEAGYGYVALVWSDNDIGKDKLSSTEVIGNIYENPGLIK